MNLELSRQRVRQARIELDLAQQELDQSWQPWRESLRRNKANLVIGGGLVSGLALATLPPRVWSRLGAALFGGTAWLARSKLSPALLGAFFAGLQTVPAAPKSAAAENGAVQKT